MVLNSPGPPPSLPNEWRCRPRASQTLMVAGHPMAFAEMKRPLESTTTVRPGSGLVPSPEGSSRIPTSRIRIRQGGLPVLTSVTLPTGKSRSAPLHD